MKKTDKTPLERVPEASPDGRTIGIKAPQEIIHIKHKISLQQYKYWVLLLQELKVLFDAGQPPDEDGFYSMRMDTLSSLLGYTPKKSEVWNDLNALKNETVAFNALGKDGQQEKYGAGFISEWKVSNSFVRFKFPSFLEKVMRGLEAPKAMFTLLNWEIFNHFTGKYEAIIYKLCKDYINSPGKRTPTMTVEQFREYMGIKNTEYQKFEDLNKRCIRGAVLAVNSSEVSDILVFPEFSKAGRKIIGLYFRVEHKKQTSLQFPDLEENGIFRFAKMPITPALQIKYLAIRPQAEIMLCIERANEYGEKQEKETGKAVNYGGLYRKAITEGWHEQQAVKNAKQTARKEELKQAVEQRQTEEEKNRQGQEAKAKVWELFQALPEDEKKKIQNTYLLQASPMDIKLFNKRGYDTASFKIYLKGQLLK